MTEQEAINEIRNRECVECIGNDIGCGSCSYKVAINALEEIQKYRELEHKLNGVDLTMLVNTFMEMAAEGEIQGYQRGRILTNEDADKWDAYLAIGNPEELKQIKENGAFTGMELAQLAIGQMKLKEYMEIGTPEECKEAVKFKEYFDELYGTDLEVANWHKNGDTEPFDNFYESALDEVMKSEQID